MAAPPAPSLVPVLLCGGTGSRLWPTSRAALPKQFSALVGPESLLQQTCRRVAPLANDGTWIALGNEVHRFLIRDQLRELGLEARILLEPAVRSTAPAIAAAALEVTERDPGTLLLVLPSDHVVRDAEAFRKAVALGSSAAAEGALVTFGIVPTRPDTGMGYIAVGDTGPGVHRVEAFVEKPDPETAAAYVASGRHLWNSGMFLFRADAYLEELARLRPEMLDRVRRSRAGGREDADLGFFRLGREDFEAIQGDSIDYAVMEHTDRAVVVPLDAGWDDAGSWDSLWRLGRADEAGNVTTGDVVVRDARGCYVRSEDRLVACLGVEDLVVVETRDAVLVSRRGAADSLKGLVEELRDAGRAEVDAHRRVLRPWGGYELVDGGEGFKVKRLFVTAGSRLSLQRHRHRAEHWVVVRGVATVSRDGEEFTVRANESVFIPLGALHRLENRGDALLEVIEVQSGSYLEEDDIERFDDVYGRAAGAED